MRILILILFIYSQTASAQVHLAAGENNFFCNYFESETAEAISVNAPAKNAEEIIGEIVSVIGLKRNFEIRSADVPNAAAVVLKGKRFILYNPGFMQKINTASKTDWAGISILAHEIGHHLNGHTLTGEGSRPALELEADEFSGFVLNKMGATLAEAQSAMQVAASKYESRTHPAKKDRLTAIATGWNNALNAGNKDLISEKKTVTKPVITSEKPEAESVLDEKYIAYDVSFPASGSVEYYVTVRNNLVAIQNNKLYIIGRLAQSNYKKYPYMFYDKEYNYLYISSAGNIYNRAGKYIGKMTAHK